MEGRTESLMLMQANNTPEDSLAGASHIAYSPGEATPEGPFCAAKDTKSSD